MNVLRLMYTTVAPRAFSNVVATAREAVASIMREDEIMKRSTDSAAMLPYWDKTDAIVDGVDAIRAGREKYLPKFAEEDASEYDERLKFTKFTNVYRDIVEQLASKPFEDEVSLVEGEGKTIPEIIKDFAENVDGAGNNLTVFSSLTFFNAINSAIDWIFVDFPTVDPAVVRTIADAKMTGIRPFWSHVLGRNVLEARVKIVNGSETLVYIRIYEPGEPDHVRIIERGDDGVVRWKLFQKMKERGQDGKTQFIEIDAGIITIGIIPLVPFATGRRDGRTFKYQPAMRDAADLQIELYQQESGLKYTRTLSAYPMLTGNGVKPQTDAKGNPKKLAIGPARVLYAPNDPSGGSASWAYIEPSATSLTFMAADVKDTISQLRELGRLPLTAQSGNLTTITAGVAANKSRSAVGAWALLLKDAIENALVITCKWLNIRDDQYSPEASVYTDFDTFAEGETDLTALDNMRKTGDLSQETLWLEMKRRRVLSPEFDAEAEQKRLLDEVPGEPEDVETKPQDPNQLPLDL